MADVDLEAIPYGAEIASFRGIKPGDVVTVVGWERPGHRDQRRVVRLIRARCQGGVMVQLDKPLKHGSSTLAIGWIE